MFSRLFPEVLVQGLRLVHQSLKMAGTMHSLDWLFAIGTLFFLLSAWALGTYFLPVRMAECRVTATHISFVETEANIGSDRCQ